jgi:ribosome-associated toxin RatA of RatAB toxin-antitoxin module
MRRIEVRAHARGQTAGDVYQRLVDFERYPEFATAVRSLSIVERSNGRLLSAWDVDFHGGLLRWTEEDLLDPVNHLIRFRLIEGDAEHYVGEWGALDEDGGCAVRFSAEFDLGIPSLDMILGPIGESALRDTVRSIIIGLLGDGVEFD